VDVKAADLLRRFAADDKVEVIPDMISGFA
jgi:hypothetical protein